MGAIKIAGLSRQLRQSDQSIAAVVDNLYARSTFFLSAERLSIARSSHSYIERLASNAENLPAVLDTLKAKQGDLFETLVGHVREVFPTVGNISVGPTSQYERHVEIRVWPTQKMSRTEPSFALDKCGTGVAQTLAILTAVMTVDNAVMIIDELSSFLHPAAAKSLLRIIQTAYSHHQYIISTHSPEVISFGNPEVVHLVEKLDMTRL